jgi:uncharacterized BrkB/YihY/UPF0761 family membrane protein
MDITHTDVRTLKKPLRLWPGVVAAVLLILARFVVPIIVPDSMIYGVLGAVVGTLLIMVWWLFFSGSKPSFL